MNLVLIIIFATMSSAWANNGFSADVSFSCIAKVDAREVASFKIDAGENRFHKARLESDIIVMCYHLPRVSDTPETIACAIQTNYETGNDGHSAMSIADWNTSYTEVAYSPPAPAGTSSTKYWTACQKANRSTL